MSRCCIVDGERISMLEKDLEISVVIPDSPLEEKYHEVQISLELYYCPNCGNVYGDIEPVNYPLNKKE